MSLVSQGLIERHSLTRDREVLGCCILLTPCSVQQLPEADVGHFAICGLLQEAEGSREEGRSVAAACTAEIILPLTAFLT